MNYNNSFLIFFKKDIGQIISLTNYCLSAFALFFQFNKIFCCEFKLKGFLNESSINFIRANQKSCTLLDANKYGIHTYNIYMYLYIQLYNLICFIL